MLFHSNHLIHPMQIYKLDINYPMQEYDDSNINNITEIKIIPTNIQTYFHRSCELDTAKLLRFEY